MTKTINAHLLKSKYGMLKDVSLVKVIAQQVTQLIAKENVKNVIHLSLFIKKNVYLNALTEFI